MFVRASQERVCHEKCQAVEDNAASSATEIWSSDDDSSSSSSFRSCLFLSLSILIVDTIQREENSYRWRIHTHTHIHCLCFLPLCSALSSTSSNISLSYVVAPRTVTSRANLVISLLKMNAYFIDTDPKAMYTAIDRTIHHCHCTSSRDWRESRNGGVIFHSTDAPIMCRCLAMHRFFSVRCRLAFITGLKSDARSMGKERQGEE